MQGSTTAKRGSSSCCRAATAIGRQHVIAVQCGLRFARSTTPGAKPAPTPAPLRTLNAATQVVATQIATLQLDRPLGVRPAGQRMQHVALLVQDLERALAFYEDVLGLDVDPDRPHHKLPYRGAWLSGGPDMIHLMELPTSPDRPQGGRNRRASVGVADIKTLLTKLEAAAVPFTLTRRGGNQAAAMVQDPDGNTVELLEQA